MLGDRSGRYGGSRDCQERLGRVPVRGSLSWNWCNWWYACCELELRSVGS